MPIIPTMTMRSTINRIYEGFDHAHLLSADHPGSKHIQHLSEQDHGLRIEFDDEISHGYWELFRPNNDLLICIVDGVYHHQYHQFIVPSQELISIRFVLSGKLAVSFSNIGKISIPQASASVTYTPKDQPFELYIDSDSHLSSVTLHLSPEALHRSFMIEKSKVPQALAEVLYDGKFKRNLYHFPLSPEMMHNILELRNMPYKDTRRLQFTEAKTTELMSRFFQAVESMRDESAAPETFIEPGRARMFKAQRILVENYVLPPTIEQLAREIGSNRSTLTTEFKKFFGTTIFDFCQDYKMHKAQDMLLGGNMSIARIAEAVGYNHPTNFTAAYKKKFGYLPRKTRIS